MKNYICMVAMSLSLASTAMASLLGDTFDFSTAKTGSVTILPLGAGGSFTAPAGPGFCVGPNSNNCVSSGLSGSISFTGSQISFSFSGSTTGATGSFVLNLTNFVPANILNVTYNSGSLISGTFGLTSFSSSSMVFTGSINDGSFSAINGRTIVFDVVTLSPPTVIKTFTPSQILPGGVSTLSIAITNSNPAAALNNVSFTDTYPSGVTTPPASNLTNTCGGAAVANAGSLVLAGGSIAAGATCQVTARVISTEGVKVNSVTVNSNGGSATATATLVASVPPVLTKVFGLVSMNPGNTTNLAFTLNNPNGLLTLTGLGFVDQLPSGLIVATPNGLAGSCGGGTITATAGGNIISLSGASLAPGASCTFSVSVTATGSNLGQLTNTTSAVSSANSGPGLPAIANIFIGDPFQVRYSANLSVGDSVVNVTHVGTASSNICANVYAFSPDEQLISCCSCNLTPNALESLSARSDLISNTLTPGVPTGVVVKLLATSGGPCNASTVTPNNLALGLAAWGTTIHAVPVTTATPATTYGVTETRFTQAILSAAELTRITTLCGFIQTNGSGFGICRSCRLGGLGAGAQ